MAHEVKIPSPGESVTEVTIDAWLKNDGDYVNRDEAIAEILSDKASLTLYAEEAGKLAIKVAEGETVEVGSTAAVIDTTAEAPAGDGSGSGQAVPVQESTQQAQAAPQQSSEPSPSPAASGESTSQSYASGVPSPSAQKKMEEEGVSADSINGTGRGGRITKGDVIEQGQQQQQQQQAPAQPQQQPQPQQPAQPAAQPKAEQQPEQAPQQPHSGASRNEWREKLTPLRRTLSKRLVSVKNETAMLTTFNEVDMSGIMELRNRYKDTFKNKHGFKIGFMGFFTMACCRALSEFPNVNSYIDTETHELVYHDYSDVGIAVSTERGLVVPIVRNAESLTLTQIEYEINRLAQKARDNKITIPEMTGGTFTITNGGVFGSLISTPILNPPQSAILGMHRTEDRPVAINGQVEIRPMMYVALSYDHRVVDGKESVSFLYRVKEYLEDPARMLLDI